MFVVLVHSPIIVSPCSPTCNKLKTFGDLSRSIESKDTTSIFTQKLRLDLKRQVHRLDLLDTLLPRQLREVGSKEHFVLPIGFEIVHQLRGIVAWRMGRGVDKDVLVLPGDPNHFVRPGIPDVTSDNAQLGEGQSYLIQIVTLACVTTFPLRFCSHPPPL